MRRGLGALALTLAALGCDGPGGDAGSAAPMPRAVAHVEPERLGVGQVGRVEIAVVTPPEHRVLPVEVPTSVPGLWLLDARTLPTERHRERWIHRTQIRFRPREPGTHRWPGQRVAVEGPEEGRVDLQTEPLRLEVESALELAPERSSPFPLRPSPPPPGFGWRALAGAFGSGAALTALLIGLAARRRRSAPSAVGEGSAARAEAPVSPWVPVQAELERARAESERDPGQAAARASIALRRYLHARFGIEAEARTTPELAGLRPPLFLASRWPSLLEMLGVLDDARFPAPPEGGAPNRARAAVRASLDQAARFVRESIPPEARSA